MIDSPLKTLLDADPNFNDEFSFGSLIEVLSATLDTDLAEKQLNAPNPMCAHQRR